MNKPNSPRVCHQICDGCEMGALQASHTDKANGKKLEARGLLSGNAARADQETAQRAEELSKANPMLREILISQIAALRAAQEANLHAHQSEAPLKKAICRGKVGWLNRCGVTEVSAE